MADIATITTMLGAITNSIAIAKTIKNTDSTLEKAELKLKIAELMESLADAKISASEIQDIIKEKDKKISGLENLLEFKEKVIRKNGMYFESNEDGDLIGEPFCSNCWDDSNKSIHLTKLYNSPYAVLIFCGCAA